MNKALSDIRLLTPKEIANELKTNVNAKQDIISSHQLEFRENHSTINQVHRITDVIEKAMEDKMICSAIFLDVAQAFDNVWHKGLIYKLNKILPKQYVELYISLDVPDKARRTQD